MYARKIRQLKFLLSQFKKEESNLSLLDRIEKLRFFLVFQFSQLSIKGAIGLTTFIMLIHGEIQAQDWVFAEPVLENFGISQDDWGDRLLQFNFFDFDSDGDEDIIAIANPKQCVGNDCDSDSMSIYFLENIKSGGGPLYKVDTVMSAVANLSNLSSVMFMDIDNDGDSDLLLNGEQNSGGGYWNLRKKSRSYYIENVGTSNEPKFNIPLPYYLNVGHTTGLISIDTLPNTAPNALYQSYFYKGQLIDIDGNGKLDFIGEIAENYPGGVDHVTVYINDFELSTVYLCKRSNLQLLNVLYVDTERGLEAKDYCYRAELAAHEPDYIFGRRDFGLFDFNHDGLKDIIDAQLNSNGDSIAIVQLTNISTTVDNSFGSEMLIDKFPFNAPIPIIFEDIDQDGDVDMFGVDELTNDIYFYENLSGVVVSGAFDNTLLSDVSIHPNPTSDQLVVSFKNVEDQKRSVNILDMKGRYLDRFTTSQNQLIVDVSSYEKGIYILELNVGESTRREKVVVQ